MARVDKLVTTYNKAKLLPLMLKTIQERTFTVWQCLIAEDALRAKTMADLELFLRYDRFACLPVPHARRPAASHNRELPGISQRARGC